MKIKTTKYLLSVITLYFFSIISFGQSKIIDSLKHVLTAAKHDTTRSVIYIYLGDQYSLNNPDSAILFYQKANEKAEFNLRSASFKISEPKLFKKISSLALNNIGTIHEKQGNYSKALEFYDKSLKLSEEISDESSIANTYTNIGEIYSSQNNFSKALEYDFKSLKKFEAIGNKSGIAICLGNIAMIYHHQGQTPKALDFMEKSMKIYKEIGDKDGIAVTLNNLGDIYKLQGNIPKALDYHYKSLKIREEMGDKYGTELSLNNIGAIYYQQGDIPKALDCFYKALKIQQGIGDKEGISYSMINIGFIYYQQRNFPKALECYDISLKTSEEMGDKAGMVTTLNNIASVHVEKNDLPQALIYYTRSLNLSQEIGDKNLLAVSLNNIANVFQKKGQLKEALAYASKGLQVAKELGYPEDIKNSANRLKYIFQRQNKYKDAFEMYELEIKMRDSINSERNRKASIKSQLKYDFDKKEAIAETEHKKELEKQKDIADLKNNRQNVIIWSIGIGLLLVLLLALFIFRGLRQKQKANLIITQQKFEVENQKHIIEEKHKEITDSINYAERIQRSFLATKELLDENLNDHFVFFQPKDVVSGDFYWASKLSNANFILATADSTGHGVPGAIMSILNISSLEKAVEKGLLEPSEIFNDTRNTIIERLSKDGSEQGGKDGMDCSLISFDFKNSKLTYSAANNPVWIVRENQILEFAADKMPVGKGEKDNNSFTQHIIELQKGDVIYALTDGMPDQFGGPKGKKFMYKKLKELLISISPLSMIKQKDTLKEVLNNWKGNLEQVDDVCIIGVRI